MRPPLPRGFLPLLFLLALAAHPALAEAALDHLPPPPPSTGPWAGYDLRYGRAPGTELSAILEKPALISMSAFQFREPASGELRLAGFGEAHAVFPLPLRALAALLEDRAGQRSWSQRLLEVAVEAEEAGRKLVYEEIGIHFLGFKVGYRVRSEFIRDELPGGALGFRARLVESLDGNLYESFASWYLEEVSLGGKPMTYLRIYSRPGIRRPFLGMLAVVRTFTPGELTGTLRAIARETRRRSGLE